MSDERKAAAQQPETDKFHRVGEPPTHVVNRGAHIGRQERNKAGALEHRRYLADDKLALTEAEAEAHVRGRVARRIGADDPNAVEVFKPVPSGGKG